MLTMRVVRLAARRSTGRSIAPGAGVAHRVAAAAHAELPATAGSARTAIAALPPLRLRSWPQPQRITAGVVVGVELGEALEVAGRHARFGRGALEGPRRGARAQLVRAGARARRGTPRSACPPRTEPADHASATGRSVPGRGGEMEVGLLAPAASCADRSRRGCAPRLCASLNVRHEVDAGGRRIRAPDDDQPRVGDSPGRPRPAILPYSAWRRAPVGAAHTVRASREAPSRRNRRGVGRVLREQPVRAAVGERQDRLAAEALARLAQPRRRQRERLVPRDALKGAQSLWRPCGSPDRAAGPSP